MTAEDSAVVELSAEPAVSIDAPMTTIPPQLIVEPDDGLEPGPRLNTRRRTTEVSRG